MKRLAVALALVASLALVALVSAASPIAVQIDQTYAYRHLLESNDLLVISRYRLVPASTSVTDTFASKTVTSEAIVDGLRLTNRHTYTDTTSLVVTRTTGGGSPEVITDHCTVGLDRQQLTCTGTGIADGTYTFEVTHLAGWSAYTGEDVVFQLLNASSVVATERTAPTTGYALVGLYLSAANVTAKSIVWGDGSTVRLLASPSLWSSPSTKTQAITWRTTSTMAATVTQLTTDLKQMLNYVEADDPNTADGALTQSAGITDDGRDMAIDAWASIANVIPEAFQSTEFNPGSDIATKSASVATDVENTAATPSVGRADEGLGSQLLGRDDGTMGAILSFAIAIVMALLAFKMSEDGATRAGLAVGLIWIGWFVGWRIGWTPTIWFAMSSGLVVVAGLLALIRDRVFGGNP